MKAVGVDAEMTAMVLRTDRSIGLERRRPRRFRAAPGHEDDEDLHRTEWVVIRPLRKEDSK